MTATKQHQLLRDDALRNASIVLAGGTEDVAAHCRRHGAHVTRLEADLQDEQAVVAAAEALGAATTVVCDAGALLRDAPAGLRALGAAVDGAWNVTRAAANAIFIPARRGLVILIAPRLADGEHAGAARAALDNLARTTSIEWARHGVRVVSVLPGNATQADAVAETVAFLASPAGGYYAGCSLELGAVGSS